MEKTLIIFKPDSFEKKCIGQVLSRFEQIGLRLCAGKMMHFKEAQLKEHYAHLADLPFFPEIIDFMRSAPVTLFVLEGENAIEKVRKLLGPTDSKEAPKTTIRSEFGTDKMRNVCHASDSRTSAEVEIKRFFQPEEIYSSF